MLTNNSNINTYFFVLGILVLSFLTYEALANNISVSNVSIVSRDVSQGRNNTANFATVQFNLSWENSWRVSASPANWDAAWVFIKFRVGASDRVLADVRSSGTTVTVNTTTGLRVGMPVRVTSGSGAFAANTVISSISSSTQFVVSASPTTALSGATIVCSRIWEHAFLNDNGHTAATGSTINAGLLTPGSTFNASTNPAVGVFIYRSGAGSGTNTFNNTQLRWNYGANGIRDVSTIDLRVFAIEMVYVPGGNFTVGDGSSDQRRYTLTSITTATTLPPLEAGEIPTSSLWPNGFNGFYCMKYELSQAQYRDFLNTLSRFQQATRVQTSISAGTVTSVTNRYVMSGTSALSNRNGIRCDATIDANAPVNFYCDFDGDGIANESTDGLGVALNFINWMDFCAYLDWAGLRIMTDMEYEKACRGPQTPVANEYAWGTASIYVVQGIGNSYYTLNNGGTNAEGIASHFSTTLGNAMHRGISGNQGSGTSNTIEGPVRVGIFAANSNNTGRVTAGATFYGIMEMTGNVDEFVAASVNGRGYTGLHGDGLLSAVGNANVINWPGSSNGEVSNGPSGAKGGHWMVATSFMCVSCRGNLNTSYASRFNFTGIRGVRSFSF